MPFSASFHAASAPLSDQDQNPKFRFPFTVSRNFGKQYVLHMTQRGRDWGQLVQKRLQVLLLYYSICTHFSHDSSGPLRVDVSGCTQPDD